jgi:opacity protein-like surface antigen
VRVALLLALAVACAAGAARAADPLAFYLGGSVGNAHLNRDLWQALGISPQAQTAIRDLPFQFDDSHHGWKVFVGFRPTSIVGAELEYIDFGTSSFYHASNSEYDQIEASAKALTLSGVFYVPLPLPLFDLFAKAGVAGLRSGFDGTSFLQGFIGACPPPGYLCSFETHSHRTDVRVAYGAGMQLKLPLALAIRAEYQKIQQSGGSPDLLSLGVSWRF